MTYKTLETIPYKVFIKIIHNVENIHLLTDEEKPDFEDLQKIWIKIYDEYIELDPNNESSKILAIEKEIAALECKHNFIQLAVCALEFDWEQELVDMIVDYGYNLTKENYYSDLDKIKRESKAILLKASQFRAKLPKQEKTVETKKINVDAMFAFYSSILGIDFDYNTVSFTKILGLQMQVKEKIKAIEIQNTKK